MKINGKFWIVFFTLFLGLNHSVYAEHESNRFGSLLGSIVGGVIGYQFGGGTGKYISTAAGAVIGSQLGKNIQQDYHEQPQYQSEYVYPQTSYNQQNYNQPSDGNYGRYQSNLYREPAYTNNRYTTHYNSQVIYIAEDDYLIKQHLSDQAKRRNMIRNGEADPYEMPYDTSTVQTSWDDPFN
ncbi:MAG: glycine zipper 2TM domain-containing protein [Pseudomonadota bacterium]